MPSEFGVMTEEERGRARARALELRAERAQLKRQMKAGELTFTDFAARQMDDVVGRILVRQAIAAMPGYGAVGARKLMERIGIDENRRMKGLGSRQLKALLAEFGELEN